MAVVRRPDRIGFTLVELLVVIAIIAVLMRHVSLDPRDSMPL